MNWLQPSPDDKVCLCVHVVRASNLPKTDRLSSIDPYLKMKVIGTDYKEKTKVIDNNPNPVWNQKFSFVVPLDVSSRTPTAKIRFELLDHDSFKDSDVGFVEVQLIPQTFAAGIVKEPFQWVKSKYSSYHSFLEVNFSFIYAFQTLAKHVSLQYPGAIINAKDHRLYVPLSPAWGPLWLAIEYEKDSIDVKLFTTEPNTGFFLDMALFTQNKTRIRRRTSNVPVRISQTELAFYEEIKIDDVPFSSDFHQLKLFRFRKQLLASERLNDVVSRHGWKGALSFDKAAKLLFNVELDPVEKEIFMPLPGSLLAIDYDADNVDMKCLVLDIPENHTKAYDLSLASSDVKKKSDVYSPPTTVYHGKYQVQRRLELDDVPYGTKFSDMIWYQYELTEGLSSSLMELVRVKPF